MNWKNWKPWALALASASIALMLAGHGKAGTLLLIPAGIMFEIANALGGGKYFD